MYYSTTLYCLVFHIIVSKQAASPVPINTYRKFPWTEIVFLYQWLYDIPQNSKAVAGNVSPNLWYILYINICTHYELIFDSDVKKN